MRKLLLVILDGFGLSPASKGNAILAADTPILDRLVQEYPYLALTAHGPEVGLRWGEMGNSDVGHANLGAGRVVMQDATRIFQSIEIGTFKENEAILGAFKRVKENQSTLHVIGLISAGGVHGHIDHLVATLKLAKSAGVSNVVVHCITDGRDSQPKDALKQVATVEQAVHRTGARLATLVGRYFAMDRDRRWERTQAAYQAIAERTARHATSLKEAIESAYADGQSDEFIEPVVIDGVPAMQDGDVVVCTNYRADRMRQLIAAFSRPGFQEFTRQPLQLDITTFTDYQVEGVITQVAFPRETIEEYFGAVVAGAGLRQLHIGETEKYAHVTYFFNGSHEDSLPGEQRILVNSPKVATYDQAPAMAAREITAAAIEAYRADNFDVLIMNYANGDMVGHTGNLEATTGAVRILDECLGQLVSEVEQRGDMLLVTADHGNAEQLIHPDTGDIDKEHTANPVPLILVDSQRRTPGAHAEGAKLSFQSIAPIGVLADVAPTALELINLQVPAAMTGRSLVSEFRHRSTT